MTQEFTAACLAPPQYLTGFKLFTSVLKTIEGGGERPSR